MSIELIIELWVLSSAIALVFYYWMMFDVIADFGAAQALVRYGVEGFGPEHVVVARTNVQREGIRIFIGTMFLMAGYVAWVRPYWAPDGLAIYLLFAGNIGLLAKSILDRRARSTIRRIIAPKDDVNG